MNHCPNLNTPAIEPGKVSAEDLRARIEARSEEDRIALRERLNYAACNGPCSQGRGACQTPEACQLPDDGSLVGIGLGLCAVCAVAVCAVIVMVFA